MSQVSSARLFLATAVPFAVAMVVFRIGHMPIAYAVSVGVVLGSLFGGASVWMQKRAEHRLEAQGIDPGDLAPVQERSEEIPGDLASVYQASRNALLKLRKLRLVKDDPVTGQLDAKTGSTFWSWGETISVRVTGDGPDTTVHISSRPRLSTTVTDSGKAVENVGLFFRYLHSELGAPAPNNRWRGPA
jgi:hypothetical protein